MAPISFSRIEGFTGRNICLAPDEEGLAGTKEKGKILVVDDDNLARSITRRMLQYEGYQVIEATSGTEALVRIKEHPRIRVALIDVVMPKMTGIELADQLSREAPTCRVVLMTGYAADRAGLSRFSLLMKPFTASELIRRIELTLTDPEH